MLVLSRNLNEGIVIRTGMEVIHLCVVDIRGDKVRLGFEADRRVEINRSEIDAKIERPNSGESEVQ